MSDDALIQWVYAYLVPLMRTNQQKSQLELTFAKGLLTSENRSSLLQFCRALKSRHSLIYAHQRARI